MREKRKTSFLKEISLMMYGCGDVCSPQQGTAELVQEYMIGYLAGLLTKIHSMARIKGKTKTEDLLYFLKKDPRKYVRVKELLLKNEEFNTARKAFKFEGFERE